MKYLITDINAKQDSNFKNVINFVDISTRDKYINRKLFNQGTRYDYTQNIDGIVVTHDIKPNGDGVITINSELTHTELSNKNYIILDECGVIKFYFINEVRKIQNSSEYKLTLKEDVFCTYPDVMTKLKYLSLIEGHVPVINYANYEFNGGNSKLVDIDPINPEVRPYGLELNNPDRTAQWSSQWLIVYRKLKNGEEGAKLKVEQYTENGTGSTIHHNEQFTLTLPYKIFGAPIVYRGAGNITGDITAKVEAITNRYNEQENDGLTYAFKIVNYEFDTQYNTLAKVCKKGKYDTGSGTCSQWDEFVEIKTLDLTNEYAWGTLKETENSYRLRIPSNINSVLELLDGISEYSLSIEHVKDFNVPIKYLTEYQDRIFIPFKKAVSFTPSDTKESITFDWIGIYPEITDEFSWTNETEMATYVNQLNEYKANNPNQWADWLKPIGELTKPGSFTSPIAMARSGINAVEGLASEKIKRGNMKKAPESVKGDAATYFMLETSFSKNAFVVKKREYIGNERKAIIDILYRNGLQLTNQYLVYEYEDIKRPKFNYIRSINATESLDYESEYPESVVEQFANIFNRGVRVWQDIENFKVYDSKWADNGEGIDDFIKNK